MKRLLKAVLIVIGVFVAFVIVVKLAADVERDWKAWQAKQAAPKKQEAGNARQAPVR